MKPYYIAGFFVLAVASAAVFYWVYNSPSADDSAHNRTKTVSDHSNNTRRNVKAPPVVPETFHHEETTAVSILGPPNNWSIRVGKEDRVALLRAIYLAASKDLAGTLIWLEQADISVFDRAIYEHLISGAKETSTEIAKLIKEQLSGQKLHFAYVALIAKTVKKDIPNAFNIYESAPGIVAKDEMGRLLLAALSINPESLRSLLSLDQTSGRESVIAILAAATANDAVCPKNMRSQILSAALSSLNIDERQIEKIAERFAVAQLDAAVEFLGTLSPGPRAGIASHRIVAQWAAANPEKAGAWLNQQTRSPLRDYFIAGYVSGIRTIDGEAANKWEATITDTAARRLAGELSVFSNQ